MYSVSKAAIAVCSHGPWGGWLLQPYHRPQLRSGITAARRRRAPIKLSTCALTLAKASTPPAHVVAGDEVGADVADGDGVNCFIISAGLIAA